MTSTVQVTDELGRPLLGLASTVFVQNVSSSAMMLLSKVWEMIRSQGYRTLGINVIVYENKGTMSERATIDIFAGVLVSEGTNVSKGLESRQTPHGPAAHVTYYGDYSGLGEAHQMLREWCRNEKKETTTTSWEVYGHNEDDPAKRRTDIYYQLR